MTTRFAGLLALIFAAGLNAQPNQRIIRRALEPANDDLSRLNLTVDWRLYLPVENRGDAIATVQPIENQVFVQLESGRLIAIQSHADPKTFKRPGDMLWTYRPRQRPGAIQPVAVGPKDVYLVQGLQLIDLDRADGKIRYIEALESTASNAPVVDEAAVYIPLANRKIVAFSTVDKIPGYRPRKPVEFPDPVHHLSLTPEPADALSTPQNRSPSIARLEVLRPPFHRGTDTIDSSPSVGMLKNIRPPYREVEVTRTPSVAKMTSLRGFYELTSKESVTRMLPLWEMVTGTRLDFSPVLTEDPTDPESKTLTIGAGRQLMTAMREAQRYNSIATNYMTEAPISAQLVARGDYLYVATADSNFIILSMRELREKSLAANSLPRAKFTTGGPVVQKPLLTDDSVYVVGERWGLIRLKRDTLTPMWVERLPDGRIRPKQNPDVVQLLAVSPRSKLTTKAGEQPAKSAYSSAYAYGLDREGRLLVIDADRGTTLSSFDVSAFTLPVTNYVDDRLYLASNNGLLLSLRDRLKVVPVRLQTPAAKKAVEPPPDVKPDAEPKKEPAKK